MYDGFDIGKDLLDAYEDGYSKALTEVLQTMEDELTKSNWYSKGKIIAIVKSIKEKQKG